MSASLNHDGGHRTVAGWPDLGFYHKILGSFEGDGIYFSENDFGIYLKNYRHCSGKFLVNIFNLLQNHPSGTPER